MPVYLAVRFLAEAAAMAQSVAIGWTVYRLTSDPLSLGLVGILQFVPMLLLTLPAGELSDRLSPRLVLAAGLTAQCLCSIGFLALAILGFTPLWPFYAMLMLLGAARAFVDPAGQAILPSVIPPERLPRAIAWSSSAWQVAVIMGPVLGGLLTTSKPSLAFGACAMGFVAAAIGATLLVSDGRPTHPVSGKVAGRLARIVEGVAFIRSRPVILGAISLDLAAVLLGGATTLLPVYARDILHAGPSGLGLLRAAPAAGSCLVALLQTRHPISRRVGLVLFAAVAAFGFATLAFAASKSLPLSLGALCILGASDMVSVNIRMALVQLATPDAMRGRVSAVSMLFIGASSELGGFESGVAADLLGTVPAVLLGGAATIAVAALWMAMFPALRRADQLATPIDGAGIEANAEKC